jgi:pro-apoptotic serine protease NMA111
LTGLKNRQRVPVKYIRATDRFRERTGLIRFSTEWQRMRWWKRNDRTGVWIIDDIPIPRGQAAEAEVEQVDQVDQVEDQVGEEEGAEVVVVEKGPNSKRDLLAWEAEDSVTEKMHASPLPLSGRAPVKGAEKSLVLVTFFIPYVIDGCYSDSFAGIGLVVDWDRGFVVVDRNTVPISLGDCMVTLGGSTEVPGRVLFLHPIHNFAVVQFDSHKIENGGFVSADLFHADSKSGGGTTTAAEGEVADEVEQGDELFLFGMSSQQTLFVQRTVVAKMESLNVREARPPRFRAINSEAIWLEKHTPSIGGVLADSHGRIRALWASFSSADRADSTQPSQFFRGIPIEIVTDVVDRMRRGEPPVVHSLDVEFKVVKLSSARVLGMSDEWVQRCEATGKRNAVGIGRTQASTPAFELLRGSDVVLAVDGNVVTSPRVIELLIAGKEKVDLTILRDTNEMHVEVPVSKLSGTEQGRIAIWAGAMLQETHRAVRQLGYSQTGGNFCFSLFLVHLLHRVFPSCVLTNTPCV